MVLSKQAEGQVLEKKLVELGFPNERRGDTRARAELLGATDAALNTWLRGDRKIPKMLWHVIKLYEQCDDSKKMEYLRWARENS